MHKQAMHELRLGEQGVCEEGGCGQCASQQRGPSSCEDFGSAMGLMRPALVCSLKCCVPGVVLGWPSGVVVPDEGEV